MDKAVSRLKGWILTFLKNRDLIFRKIKGIDEMDGSPAFRVDYADHVLEMVSTATLDEDVYSGRKEDEHFGIACYNTQKNFSFLVSHWEVLKGFKHLTIYFINPFTEGETKWVLRPYNHAMIADSGSFQTGLQSMFSMVEQVREEDLKRQGDL